MRKLFAGILVVALAGFTGCNNSTPGGPGAVPKTTPQSRTGAAPVMPSDKTGTSADKTTTPVTPAERTPAERTPAERTPAERTPTASERTKDTVTRSDETFTLGLPMLSTHVMQGESKEATISIKRGRNFTEDVTLKFDNVPPGVTIEMTSPSVGHADKELKINIKANETATPGDYTIRVTGQPQRGAEATGELKINVVRK
jgi:hypothetical protein